MKQTQLLSSTFRQLHLAYKKHFPRLVEAAKKASDVPTFKDFVRELLEGYINLEGKEVLHSLLENDGTTIREMSYDREIPLDCFTRLWHFLREDWDTDGKTDLYIDFFMLFDQLDKVKKQEISLTKMQEWTSRWPSGLQKSVMKIREENKERILHLLIDKVERSSGVRYHFEAVTGRKTS